MFVCGEEGKLVVGERQGPRGVELRSDISDYIGWVPGDDLVLLTCWQWHFFCGIKKCGACLSCSHYSRALSSQLMQSVLEATMDKHILLFRFWIAAIQEAELSARLFLVP